MNRKYLVLLVIILMLAMLAFGCGAPDEATETDISDDPDAAPAETYNFKISAGLSPAHFWVGNHMDPFADRIEEESNGAITFERYYAGELVSVGRELDALGSSIDVAAPFLAPYHEGQFPLSDVTQLPVVNTTSEIVTRAFQSLMDSDVVLKDGQTFYQYEIESKGMRAWPLGVTGAYVLSTTGRIFEKPEDLKGVPLRSGSALHTMFLEELGCIPVYMPGADAYEAMSRNTIEGIVYSIGDWVSYGFEDLLTYSIVGMNAGHWGSYLAMKEETFQKLSPDLQELWDRIGREIAIENARYIDQRDDSERIRLEDEFGAVFQDINELDPALQARIQEGLVGTWKRWIDILEAEGHPGREVAKLYAELLVQEGGGLPDGVEELFK